MALENKWDVQVQFAHLCTKDQLVFGKRLVPLTQKKGTWPFGKGRSLPPGLQLPSTAET